MVLTLFMLCVGLIAKPVNIAVAANVSYAMDDLIEEFQKQNPKIKIRVTLGSSGKLTAQISRGAPYELFMSANMLYPNSLYEKNIAITKPLVYAKGGLALFGSKELDLSKGLSILEQKSVKRVAIANPKTAPYGKASIEALRNAKLYEKIKDKFVYAESVSQAVVYSISAADVGFVALSALYSPKMKAYKKGKNWVEVEHFLYEPIEQGVVLLKKSSSEAKKFYNFILSKKAKKIFKNYGYIEDGV